MTCSFDRELRATIEKYSNDGLLSAGEIVAVLEVVKHATIHAAENAAADTEVDNFTSTNSAMDAIAELAEKFIVSNKCDESVSIMLRCFAEYVRQQHQ
jgi:hypothetical protein